MICKKINNQLEEFINLDQVKIDSNHFAVTIYSKTNADRSILYTDTLVGKLQTNQDLKTEWFKDSVRCLVPTYIPENIFLTHTKLKVILRHK